jgi:uncharacterized protein YjiS (DUF1127 family)
MKMLPNSAFEEPKPVHRNALASLVRWLRHVQQKAHYEKALRTLPERQLQDIGIDPRQFVRSADTEVERLGLLDIGWQQPRRPTRR